MKEKSIRYLPNDLLRHDGRPGYISCTISLPNYKLFYRYMQTYGGKWCVLLLKPEVLWEKECLFFHTNAASCKFRNVPDESFKGMGNFIKMFDDVDKRIELSEYFKNGLSGALTTDPQAETMVKDVIAQEYIMGCAVKDINDVDGKKLKMPVFDIPAMFEPRPDYEKWRSNGREIDLLAAI